MPHIWFRDNDDTWSAMQLNGHAVDVTARPPRFLAEGFRLGEDAVAALIPAELADSSVWVLLIARDGDVRVNGFPPVAGMRVLQDRDEIRAAAADPLFFSTETQARVEEFTQTDRAIYCARCRRPIENGEMAVRCPRCGIWYHQGGDYPCWTYSPSCGFCPQSTELEAGFDWTPEA